MGAKRSRETFEGAAPEGGDEGEGEACAPRLRHCFLVGDLVEGMFVDNCWVSGRVAEARQRQLLVLYDKEAAELAAAQITGPRHTCKENETPRDVARKTGVPLAILISLNSERYPDLVGNSRLKDKTTLVLPELHVCGDNDTPRAVAKRYGRSLDLLLEQNGAEQNGMTAGMKLRVNQQLVLPAAGAGEAEGGGGWMPPQLGELVELLRKGGGEGAGADQADGPMEEEGDVAASKAHGGAWVLAEVVQLVAGGGFHARLSAEAAGAEAGSKPESLEGSEALWEFGEGELWRRRAPGGVGGRGGRAGAPPAELALGSSIEVEVEDDVAGLGRPGVRWRPAEVRALLERANRY